MNSGKCASQKVKLTFQKWDYRDEYIVEIEVNVSGIDAITHAVDWAHEKLLSEGVGALRMHNPAGKTCLFDIEEQSDFYKLVVGAEIIDITPTEW